MRSSTIGWIDGQMLRSSGDPGGPSGTNSRDEMAPMSSTGTMTSINRGLRTPASTMRTGRGVP